MKKILIIISVLSVLFLSSCSTQERVNPLIFINRLSDFSDDISINTENCYYEKSEFVAFLSYKNNKNILLKMFLSNDNSIKKISVSADYNKEIFEFIKIIIKNYSPNEECERIIDELIKNSNNFRYSFGKEYTYSVFLSDKTIYFEAFCNSLSEYTVPDLTLKPNDKTEY